jgi:hypothetical protein
MKSQRKLLSFGQPFILLISFLLCLSTPLSAADPYSAQYCSDTSKLFWFIQASDTHIGTRGSTDTSNLQWLVGEAKDTIDPSFIVVSGDLTDSTNGNLFGYPNGPYQTEWDAYTAIVDPKVNASIYFDLPGNHDAYSDANFAYYRANSVQGRATGGTQVSWIRTFPWGKYHFLGLNTADNTGAPFSLSWPYGDYAGLDETELSFIHDKLLNNQDAALTMIFGHHPLGPTGNSADTYLYYGKDTLVGYMQTYGSSLYGYGHTHVSSESFYGWNAPALANDKGAFYFNISALGKDSPNQFAVTAIDCNGISTVTQTVGTWPVVLITTPMDRRLGGIINPFAYNVTNAASNPIRALVFDPSAVTLVQSRVNGGTWQSMASVSENPHLWQGIWNASALPEGEYTLDVQATTSSGVRTDTVTTYVKSQVMPKVGVSDLITGKYITSGSGKNKTTVFSPTSTFKRGETVTLRATVKNLSGTFLSNATVELAVTGPSTVNLTSGPSNSSGIAEAKWITTAPNKRGQGGTPAGNYTVTVTNLIAAGYQWDGLIKTATFNIQ